MYLGVQQSSPLRSITLQATHLPELSCRPARLTHASHDTIIADELSCMHRCMAAATPSSVIRLVATQACVISNSHILHKTQWVQKKLSPPPSKGVMLVSACSATFASGSTVLVQLYVGDLQEESHCPK